MVEFALLAEADRLDWARQTDARYHQAKLYGQAMTTEGWNLVLEEHTAWRASLVDTPAPRVTPDLMARAAELWKRCRAAEARHGAH